MERRGRGAGVRREKEKENGRQGCGIIWYKRKVGGREGECK